MGSYKYHHPTYTKETHPWKGFTFTGWPPGTYCPEGHKPFLPTKWILTHPEIKGCAAIQNTKKECAELVKSYGAKVKWKPAARNRAGEEGRS